MGADPPAELLSNTIRRFEAKVRRGCRLCGLWERKAPLLIGVSGGADSTALSLALLSLAREAGKTSGDAFLVLHVHHGLRPRSAERDAAHVKSMCRRHGLRCRVVSVQVSGTGRGLEAAAREARRRAFREEARRAGAEAVVLAHTQDDQAENVLMRLFEGGGPRGLAGMRSVAPLAEGAPPRGEEAGVVLLRPLLGVSRAEIREYLRARGAAWVEDESNADESRYRNLIRRRIWPPIVEALGPEVGARVAGAADQVAALLEVLEEALRRAEERFLVQEKDRIRIGPLSEVARLPQSVRAGLWRSGLDRLEGPAEARGRRRPLGRLIEGIERLAMEGAPSARLDLPGPAAAMRDYDFLILGRPAEPAAVSEGEVALAVPGRTEHPALGVEIGAELKPAEGLPTGGGMEVFLDPALLGEGVVVRARREGDRFRPAGEGGSRKLKEFFIDRKVPRRERDSIPLLALGSEILWVVGHAVSDRHMARPGPAQAVALKARFREVEEKEK